MSEAVPHAPEALRAAFSSFPSGVTAVAAIQNGLPAGLAASSFTSVSLDPPLVSVCVAHSSTTWPLLRPLPSLGLSVLAEEHGVVARNLAVKKADRFAEIDWASTEHGAVFVHGAALWLECSLESEFLAGDHSIALLRLQRYWTYPEVAPLVFHGSRFRALRD